MADREEILRILRAHKKELAHMGVRSLALFGSVARGEQRAGSDVDLLVDFISSPGFRGYMRLKERLESLLGCRVDLVMRSALLPEAQQVVEEEAIYVA